MCGIVGYIGGDPAAPFLLQGLEKLEYRGYDSAGVAVYDGTSLRVVKAKGRLQVLKGMTAKMSRVPWESAIPVGRRTARLRISIPILR